MQRKLSFRQRLFLHFSIIFAGFTTLVLIFQFEREKSFRRSNFEVTLDDISELTHNYIQENGIYENGHYPLIDSLVTIVPESNIRITVIEKNGNVLYDSEVIDAGSMENHIDRPEIQEAFHSGFGSNIRESETTGNSYYYYARLYPEYLVRTAALYNVQVKDYLHVERLFIAYLVLLFLIVSLVLMILTRRFSETITKLKEFSIRIRSGEEPAETIQFPSDELGVISGQITSIYRDLNQARLEISAEREKLFSHLNALNEGIAFYDSDKKPILTNQQFIQNLNLISDESSASADKVFEINELEPIVQFIDTQLKENDQIDPERLPSKEVVLQITSRFFTVKCMFFSDRSFEIVITDSTKLEKRKLIKQQMTSNIAHELRTPVASVLGYLETLQQKSVPKETRKHFLKRAYAQAERLSDLVEDIASLNKIMEAGNTYTFGPLNISKIVNEVLEHLRIKLETNRIIVHNDLPAKLEVNGNASLLYSVFYNLFENAIKYGGEDIEIHLTNYLEDKQFLYFSFANTGEPIEEVHLTRLFERFYRIDDGRSRHRGGTGLGLAIVKNAIELHKGKITVRNYKEEKGVEFLFTLSK